MQNKRFVGFSLSVLGALVLGLGACGGSSGSNAHTNVLGVVLPYTGASSSAAFNLEHAILLAMEQVNGAGGAGGKPLSLLPVDSASNLVIGYRVAQQIVDAQPVAVMGPEDVSLIPALVAAAQAGQVLTLSAGETYSVTNVSLQNADYWFRLNPAITPIATALAQRAYADGHRKVSICYIDDDYGQNYKTVFGEAFQILGGSVYGYQFELNQAFSSQTIQAPLKTLPDAIFMATPPAMGADITNSLGLLASNESYNLSGWYFAPALDSDLFSTNKIPQIAANGYGAVPQVNSGAQFAAQFSKRWLGEVPTNDAYFYYDAVIYLALAMNVATQQTNAAPNSNSVRSAMLSNTMNSGTSVTSDDLATALQIAKSGQPFIYQGVTGTIQFQSGRDRANIVPAFWTFDAAGEKIVNAN